MAEETVPPPKHDDAGKKPDGKKGGFAKKYRWYILGGIVVLGLMFVLARGSNGASASGTAADTAAQNGINPGTGYLYGSPADIAAQGGSATQTPIPGPAGPAGPAGPTGAAGKTGPAGASGVTPSPTIPRMSGGTAVRGTAKASGGTAKKVVPVSHSYTVKPGDNLSKIASKLNVKGGWRTLYSLNKAAIGKNPSLIHPGLTLRTK